jgi:predicted PurR-regulated permease PerM
MDFKILLIIFVLFIGILYIIKEVITLKKETIKISNLIDNSLNNNIKGLKNRLNVVASEIKNYNNDLVIQIKKINSINSQVITSMSNYYTESESDGNKNLIDYFYQIINCQLKDYNFMI